jgi:hypothetical protein
MLAQEFGREQTSPSDLTPQEKSCNIGRGRTGYAFLQIHTHQRIGKSDFVNICQVSIDEGSKQQSSGTSTRSLFDDEIYFRNVSVRVWHRVPLPALAPPGWSCTNFSFG